MKTKKLLIVVSLLVVIATLFSSCSLGASAEYYEKSFMSMDTLITIKLSNKSKVSNAKLTTKYLEELINECKNICAAVDGQFSRTVESSFISRLNTGIETAIIQDDATLELFTTSQRISKDTNGAFDITVGALTDLWNVSGSGPKPSDDKIATALTHVGYKKLSISSKGVLTKADKDLIVDLGAIGKGYALSQMIECLSDSDSLYGLVSVGGNVGVYGNKDTSFKIGICNPKNTSGVVGYVYIDKGVIAVSGDYERYFIEDGVKYHHIFDTSTGYPAKTSISSVSVICEDATIADALSTALFVMDYEKAMEFYNSEKYNFEAIFVLDNGEICFTNGLKEKYELSGFEE